MSPLMPTYEVDMASAGHGPPHKRKKAALLSRGTRLPCSLNQLPHYTSATAVLRIVYAKNISRTSALIASLASLAPPARRQSGNFISEKKQFTRGKKNSTGATFVTSRNAKSFPVEREEALVIVPVRPLVKGKSIDGQRSNAAFFWQALTR